MLFILMSDVFLQAVEGAGAGAAIRETHVERALRDSLVEEINNNFEIPSRREVPTRVGSEVHTDKESTRNLATIKKRLEDMNDRVSDVRRF